MKTAILVFLYAAGSLAQNLGIDCLISVEALPNCSKSRLEPTSTSSVAASETSQAWVSSNGDDALWKTDATDYSIHLNCTLKGSGNQTTAEIDKSQAINDGSAIGDFRDSIEHLLPNQSATCFVFMLDEDGNTVAESQRFRVDDVGRSSTTGSALPITGAASYSTATPLSRFTDAATSNATVTASSSMSLSTSASFSLPLTAPPTTQVLIMTSTVFATTPAKTTSSGSNPNVRVQTVIGILAGAVAFALVIGT